jgi:sec-independent protein translocase protein TatB
MFGMGIGELVLILVVALLVVGPDKLPGAAKAIGKGIRDLRRHTQDLQDTIEKDEKLGEAVRELKSALSGVERPYRPIYRPPSPPSLPAGAAAADPGAASSPADPDLPNLMPASGDDEATTEAAPPASPPSGVGKPPNG